MSTDDFEIISGVDQPTPVKIEDTVFKRIDAALEKAIAEKDPCIALSMGNSLIGVMRVGGLGLAKIFHTLQARWPEFECEYTIYEMAEQELGILAKATVDRYVAVWEMMSGGYIPHDLMPYINAKPIRQLVPMASLISQDYDVKTEDWVRLAHAPDAREIGVIVREIKGKPAKKSSMQIILEANGDLKAWQNKKMKELGWLNLSDDSEIVKKAIDRICDGCGIIRR